jgi:hypothetical protein
LTSRAPLDQNVEYVAPNVCRNTETGYNIVKVDDTIIIPKDGSSGSLQINYRSSEKNTAQRATESPCVHPRRLLPKEEGGGGTDTLSAARTFDYIESEFEQIGYWAARSLIENGHCQLM